MSKPSTLFIVGAGASRDFGLPVGAELQAQIAGLVRPNHNTETGLHPAIEYSLQDLYEHNTNLSEVIEQCDWMARTLPLAPSIDTFLERQSEPGDALSLIGKIAIAFLINEREVESPLSNAREPINFHSISNTWIAKLWRLTNIGGSAKAVENPLPNISFLTFNYDRCIEQFLLAATSEFYRISLQESAEITSRIPVEHVYGSLGGVDPNSPHMPIGRKIATPELLGVARQIRTFSEQVESEAIERIGNLLRSSKRIVFLGFSFAKINTDFLREAVEPEALSPIRQVYATSYNMSFPDTELAKNWSEGTFRRGNSGAQFDKITAGEFFDQRSLMFG